jgi:hypothetical protein
MHHDPQTRTTDGANALGSRVLCVLFAIFALCVTPLGRGDLFVAESHVYERGTSEAHGGDLVPRFAMQGSPVSAFETAEERDRATLFPVHLDDGPGALAGVAPLDGGGMDAVQAGLPSPGAARRTETGFEARAPPRA